MQTWLFQQLLPFAAPAVIGLLVQAVKALLPTLSGVQNAAAVKPYLPFLAAVLGGAYSQLVGDPLVTGVLGGLAATGMHQAITQPTKGKDA